MSGDSSSQHESMVSEHAELVWRVIVRLLGENGELAEECFQETFSQFFERCRNDNVPDCAAALLSRIAARRAIDALRSRIRDRSRLKAIDEQMMSSMQEHRAENSAETSELLSDLRVALAGLPEKQAAAFILTQIEGMSHHQAGLALQLADNHINVLVHRARATLRKCLSAHNNQPAKENR